MDFPSLLTEIPSGVGKDLLIAEVVKSESHFSQLYDLALHEKDPLAWRAGWILDGSDEKRPELARKHIPAIVEALPTLESLGTLRSLLRLLSRHDIPEEKQGLLIDLCFGYLHSEKYPVAVKAHAMQIIYNHVRIYPELKVEFLSILEDEAKNNSAGFKARASILMKQMEKL
ncbi:MAG: hypothetical protein P1P86_00125 [Bacteroidales bacterium]|nr:hypothetical protein [Bacteroidales bacterium]